MSLATQELVCGKSRLSYAQKTLIMGVLNVTPDSFYEGSRYSPEQCLHAAKSLATDGADILDVGGESTRPGSKPLSPQEEIERVVPVIEQISANLATPISIDTTKSEVAKAALQAGASIINDISGFRSDKKMVQVIVEFDVPAIVMHMRGTPANMQENTKYNNLMGEIAQSLEESIQLAEEAGVRRDRLVIDPGIGFGKNVAQNFQIIKELSQLKRFDLPILLGPSRKSFIGKTLDLPPEERLEGTAAAVAIGIYNGANILRVHDVKAMKRVAIISDALK